jgi:hypothetical protein
MRNFCGQGQHHTPLRGVIPLARAEIAVQDRLHLPAGWSCPYCIGELLLGLREACNTRLYNERFFLANVRVKAAIGETRLCHEIVNASSLDPGSVKLARRLCSNACMSPLCLLL